MEVGPVENPPEDTIRPGVVGVDQRLIGYAVRHKPHPQEKEEEEDVLYLEGEEGIEREKEGGREKAITKNNKEINKWREEIDLLEPVLLLWSILQCVGLRGGFSVLEVLRKVCAR